MGKCKGCNHNISINIRSVDDVISLDNTRHLAHLVVTNFTLVGGVRPDFVYLLLNVLVCFLKPFRSADDV